MSTHDPAAGSTASPVIEVAPADQVSDAAGALASAAPTTLGQRLGAWLENTRGRGALEIGLIFVVLQVGCVVAALIWPDDFRYLSEANFNLMTQSVPVLALLSIAVGLLMITGEFDLSIGLNYTFCGLVFLNLYLDGLHGFAAALVTIAVGITIALINAFVTTRFLIPSFIVTLGAMLFWDGAGLWYNGPTAAIISRGPLLETVFAGNFFGLRAPLFWLLGVGVVCWFLLHRHRLGNHMYAVGGNEAAAKAISISPIKVKWITWGILGALAALAALLAVVRVESMVPGTGRGLELMAIAGAVVGGTSLRGGKGSVLGMVLGAWLIWTVQDILLLARAPGFYLDVFVGSLIVVFAVFNRLAEGKAR